MYSFDELACYQKPSFVGPTILHGSYVAIPPGATFATQLIADSGRGSSNALLSIVEIQTMSPVRTTVGELAQIPDSNRYYVNIMWTPGTSQQNLTQILCFTAINSDHFASDQSYINLLPGYYPPAPIQETAVPNQGMIHSSNATWHITFDTDVERPSVVAYIMFNEYTSDEEIYSVNVSQSPEVTFEQPNVISITPNYTFDDQAKFYITFTRGVVQGIEQCRPGNEPISDKNFLAFETVDLIPPVITFLLNPSVTNTNVSFAWKSNENATWACILVNGAAESIVNCSEASWMGYGLSEGEYHLNIHGTDEAGNTATAIHIFEIDLTPPASAIITSKPRSISNQQTSTLTFSCAEICSYECRFVSNMTQEFIVSCDSGMFNTPILQSGTNYALFVTAIDQAGN